MTDALRAAPTSDPPPLVGDAAEASWCPGRTVPAPVPLPLPTALWRGARGRCPACGEGHLFRGYLKVSAACDRCGVPLGRFRADDAPPYFVIFLVGHLLVPVVFWVERTWEPPMWLHMAIWLPLFAIACTLLLRPVKGATLGWMLCMNMGAEDREPDGPTEARGGDGDGRRDG